jgi:REP element-mobilizing transposase RayT
MGRFTRVVAVDVPHHVTQRGNGRRFVLEGDADRAIYLNLLRENIVLYGVALIGYCLMSNHIHLIAIPHKAKICGQDLWSDGTGTLLEVVNWPPLSEVLALRIAGTT